MVITDVSVQSYRAPLARPIRNGKYVYTHTDPAVVKVTTDEGLVGVGLSDGAGLAGGAELVDAIVKSLRPLILGEDPLDVERLWASMWVPKLVGRRGFTTRVISAVDIALWDLRGKILSVPVYKLLGGYRARVPAYMAGGYYEEGKGLRELASEMEGYLEHGARAVKMKIGGVPMPEDIERVRVVRDAIGPNAKLMVDANNAYRPYEAAAIARKIEQFDIFWFEEPVMPDDYRGHALVAEATSIPVATGENEYTRYGFRDIIEHRAAAILTPDAQILGGVTEFMKVAAFAQAYDIPVAPHGNQLFHVHLTCAVPNGLIVEYYRLDPLWELMFEELELVDGEVSPPDRPGFGIELDEEALAPYRVS